MPPNKEVGTSVAGMLECVSVCEVRKGKGTERGGSGRFTDLSFAKLVVLGC